VDLVRDLLDKPIRDHDGREMGRVDGIVLERRDGARPRVSALLVGPSVLGSRLHPVLGRWIAAFEIACGIAEGRPIRIDFNDVAEIGDDVKVDVAATDTAAGAVEQIARRWLRRVPGGG
jgi:sporulation protein YlmC with PRC-barrel domain